MWDWEVGGRSRKGRELKRREEEEGLGRGVGRM
jgi:hypothetical protein